MGNRNPLVDVTELAELARSVTTVGFVVLDVRWRLSGPSPSELYAGGHLPGAIGVDLNHDLAGPVGGGEHGRHPLPETQVLQATLRRWGVKADSTVVAYDDADGSSAARAWWLLRWAGLTDVRVLNGGIAAWVGAGQPITTEVPEPAPGDVVVRSGGMPTLDADGAAGLPDAGGVLLDARAEARYRGEVEPVDPVAGHIPGARSAPFGGNVDEDGRFLEPERLRERFAALGVRPDGAVGAYCGSGVTAAQAVLALEVAGVPAALYPGSWSEWVADPARPVATGPDPAAPRA
jgi:thiosulfate/3-mercaptopyruvate sulfurtransferase